MNSSKDKKKKIAKLSFKILLLLGGILFDTFMLLAYAGKLDKAFFIMGLSFGPYCTLLGIILLLKKLTSFSLMIIIGCIILVTMFYINAIMTMNLRGAYM